MIAGNDSAEKNNPSLIEATFKFLRTDIYYIKAALGWASIPTETLDMRKVKTALTKSKNSAQWKK